MAPTTSPTTTHPPAASPEKYRRDFDQAGISPAIRLRRRGDRFPGARGGPDVGFRFAAEELDDSQDHKRDDAESDDSEGRRMPPVHEHAERQRGRDDAQRALVAHDQAILSQPAPVGTPALPTEPV